MLTNNMNGGSPMQFVDTTTLDGIARASGQVPAKPPTTTAAPAGAVSWDTVRTGQVDAPVLGVVAQGDSVWSIAHQVHESLTPEMKKLNTEAQIRDGITTSLVQGQGYDAKSADSKLDSAGRRGQDLDLLQPGQQVSIDLNAPAGAPTASAADLKTSADADHKWVQLNTGASPGDKRSLAQLTLSPGYGSGQPQVQDGALTMFAAGGTPRALVTPLVNDPGFLRLMPEAQAQVLAFAATPTGAAAIAGLVGNADAPDKRGADMYIAATQPPATTATAPKAPGGHTQQ